MLSIKDLIKIFTDWTKLKLRIHLSDRKIFPHEREIWWASLGQNIGVEINGKNNNFERPVVIIKVFNCLGSLVAPITSKIKQDKYFIAFSNNEKEKNSINMSQIRSISSKRLIRKIGELDNISFEKIKLQMKKMV